MKREEFNKLKAFFQQESSTKISDPTFYRYLRYLKETDLEPSKENIKLIVNIKNVTCSVDSGLEAYYQFCQNFDLVSSLSRKELEKYITEKYANVHRETFRRWLNKAKIQQSEYKSIALEKIFLVVLQAFLYYKRKLV